MKKVSSLLIFILLMVLSLSSFAKPLYMTVRRDFSPKESAEIEISYTSGKPVMVRILKPKDLKGFIAGQMDLRRAWREPKLFHNPIHFLATAQNQSDLKTDWIRLGVDSEVRKQAREAVGGAYEELDGAQVQPGTQKLIAVPDGFEVVNEISFEPEQEDKTQPFDVPGFWYSSRSGLQSKVLKLPPLASGFYVAQMVQGDVEGQVVLVVNDLLAQLQHSQKTLIYRVSDRSGRPLDGVEVEVRNLAGKWIKSGKTDGNGELVLENVGDTELISLVRDAKRGSAIIDSEYFSTSVSFPDVFLMTDRPMYRIGDTIHFRGIVRELKNGTSSTEKKVGQVEVFLQGLDGKSMGRTVKATIGNFGTFSGSFKAADNSGGVIPEGVYRVAAKISSIEHTAELRVNEYRKPQFFITISSPQETLKEGDTLKAKLKVERYAGGVPNIDRTEVSLYRVRMMAPQWVEDAGMGETGSDVTYGFDSSGAGASSMLPQLIEVKSDVVFDEKGEAQIEMQIGSVSGPKNFDYQFVLKVFCEDSDETFANASKSFADLAAEVVAQAKFNKVMVQQASEARLDIRSVSATGKPIPHTTGYVEYYLQSGAQDEKLIEKKDIKTNAKGLAQSTLPKMSEQGEVSARIVLFDAKNQTSVTEASVIVVGGKMGAQIVSVAEPRLVSNESVLAPQDKIKILMLLPDGWGESGKNQGKVFLTIAGSKYFSRKVISVRGHSLWIEEPVLKEYGTGVYFVLSYVDPRQGWVERRSAFRIVDRSLSLKTNLRVASEMTVPGGKQKIFVKVTDQAGQPVQGEVSLAVVDRSVLDLQPEIRPRLLDFFYPPTRLNLMSFLSTQFQGYGYGEEIAKNFSSNFSMAAAKSAAKILDQNDTAYWNAKLVTNEKGEAEVSFDLPGNQTIWRVTAVAVDNSGRFGESTSEFKSQSPVSVLIGMPLFMRQGDQSKIRVNLANVQKTETVNISYNLKPEGPRDLKFEAPVALDKALKPGAQHSFDVPMVALGDGEKPKPASVVGELKVAGSTLRFRDTLRVLSRNSLQDEYVFPEKGKFKFKLGQNESVQDLTLSLNTGLSSTLLASMEWMVRYPYGCVEQLLSTTVPNLVAHSWLSQAQKSGLKLDARQTKLLQDAGEFGRAGFAQLSRYRDKESDGYKWFPQDSAADPNMSLMIMAIVTSFVGEVDVFNLGEFSSTYRYLKQQNFADGTPQGVLLSYIGSIMFAGNHDWPNREQTRGRLRLQYEYVKTKGTLIEKAWLLLALHHFNFAQMESEKKQLASLLESEIEPVVMGRSAYQSLNWNPLANGWSSYPGRWVSSLAMISRALRVTKSPKFDSLASSIKWQILSQYNGEHFGSTFDTAQTLLAAGEYVVQELKQLKSTSDFQGMQIKVAGQEIKANQMILSKGLLGATLQLPTKGLNKTGTVEVEAQVPSQFIARLKVRKLTPLAQVAPRQIGWSLQRQYSKVNSNGSKSPLTPGRDSLKVGDLVLMEIAYQNLLDYRPVYRSKYYMMSALIPAGFTVVQEDEVYRAAPFNLDLRGGYRTREISVDEIRWYFDFSRGWMDKKTNLSVLLRASSPGQFEGGLVKMMDFYDEAQTSVLPADRFNILSSASR